MVFVGEELPAATSFEASYPYVIYQNASRVEREKFYKLTHGQNFIFNPFSREYWKS